MIINNNHYIVYIDDNNNYQIRWRERGYFIIFSVCVV
jgi:hypothetical protein